MAEMKHFVEIRTKEHYRAVGKTFTLWLYSQGAGLVNHITERSYDLEGEIAAEKLIEIFSHIEGLTERERVGLECVYRAYSR